MKKSMSILAIGAMIAGNSIFASNTLQSQLSNLELKLGRVKTISILTKKTQEQQDMIDCLTGQLKDTQYTLSKTQEQLKADSINIKSLTSNNKTFRDLKAQLEKESIQAQQQLTSSYNENIINIQKANEEKFNEMLDQYTSNEKTLKNQIADLNKEIQSQNKTIQNLKDRSIYYEDTINALDLTITSLTTQKNQLEKGLTATQQETIDAYKKQIAHIDQNAEDRVNKIKAQYSELAKKNNAKTQLAAENYGTKLAARKRVLRDQLNVLIAKVNGYEDNLFQMAMYFLESADTIGKATAQLEKAYKNTENPFPQKSYMGGMMANIGLEQENPSWTTIQAEVEEVRNSAAKLRGIADDLSKSNLNNKNLLENNQHKSEILWGLFS